MEILKEIFDNKLVKIITLFVDNPDKKYSLSEIAELSKINITTSYRILNQLISKKIVKLVRIGKAKLYELEKN
jgi:DNA-binding IclR family transcriptional regulator